ncbi:hypothetical protein EWZ95_05060 [Helicobacter pylori]|uniref:hypothetical protein n=1 Tax=Helicobacter pylori TaxID=210 RepID=UPI0011CD309B|nr:hypothetical protein [Helicobacter pylori]NHA86277.1 hypothetical protein [Helicobacter pylori]NHA90382.1 hypothetical protein [Helicobacter pylori]QEF23327.1 hypothetical protein D2C85_00100 [Helicobacter pylori]QEF24299.1 hypothetical protein D2C85_05880 [Helicobacter pylori]
MQDFINGFLKAWKAWSDDGKDAFLESFLDEVKSSQNDPSNFLGILEQEIKSLSQEGLQDDMSSMLEVIESMKNEISNLKDNENVSDFMNVLQNEISQGQNNSNDNPNEFVESLAQAITKIQENKNELEQQELERKESDLESKALQDYDESQNPDTLYEQQIAQEQIEDKEERLLNNQDLELETLRDDNTKQGLDDENLELLESLQIIRDETNEVANSIRANETIELLRPIGENTTSKIASLALEENNKLNEKETNTQEQNTEKEQEKLKIGNDIDFKDKYANLHSFFKQTELDIKQKRIKTKLDFKESFLNYAKNHMNEDELKVLLVVSQKESTKLTKEHINLIKDCLEQAHGNKHMQDKGLQLSVKSILGHELEKEHHEALKDYMQKSKDSLEPMDNRVYEVMQKHLDKQQEKVLKNLDSTTQSVGVNAIKEQNKANENAQQENTKESQVTQQNSTIQAQKEPHADEPWLDYDPKNHAGLKERQENQEKTPSKGNDEPWIEHGKRMQEKAKAHYQACLEKERAKQNQQNTQNTIENQNKEVPTIDYGYTQNTPDKSRRR